LTVTLNDLPGVWRRSLLAWPDGTRDTTTTVLWVQGPTLYADLRQGVPHEGAARQGAEALLVRAGSYIAYATSEPEISIGRLDGDGWVVGWSNRPELLGEPRPLEPRGWQVSYTEGKGL
jgi:hypothetical protein